MLTMHFWKRTALITTLAGAVLTSGCSAFALYEDSLRNPFKVTVENTRIQFNIDTTGGCADAFRLGGIEVAVSRNRDKNLPTCFVARFTPKPKGIGERLRLAKLASDKFPQIRMADITDAAVQAINETYLPKPKFGVLNPPQLFFPIVGSN